MNTTGRQLQDAFVELADTLVADYDVIDFLGTLSRRVVDLLGVTACGLVLADHHRSLSVVAASTEQARLLELFELQNSEGPCYDCFHSAEQIHAPDLAVVDKRWPRFAPAARETGYKSVHAIPMRLRDVVIGAMNLFGAEVGDLDAESAALGQALADMATIGILHERSVRHYETVADQLQIALNSRIVIEQAKGALAERTGRSVDEAFDTLRRYARSSNQKLQDVAAAVVSGNVDAILAMQTSNKDRTPR